MAEGVRVGVDVGEHSAMPSLTSLRRPSKGSSPAFEPAGGTNTDAVVLLGRGSEVLGWSKAVTTEDVLSGVVAAVEGALRSAGTGVWGGVLSFCLHTCRTAAEGYMWT